MTQKLLHRSNVVAGLQKMSRERMAQAVRAYRLTDACLVSRLLDCVVQTIRVDVVAPNDPAPRIDGPILGREYELPTPFAGGTRIFTRAIAIRLRREGSP
jgi:hypothetical protein